MRRRRLFIHRRPHHMQRPDAAFLKRRQGRVGMGRAAGAVAGVDYRRDARIQQADRRESRAQVHVLRAVTGAELFRYHIDIGKEIVNIGHQTAHYAEPHMVMGIYQPRHHNMPARINHFCPFSGKIFAHGDNMIPFHQHVTHRQIGHAGVQRQNDAAFKYTTLLSHGSVL